jgi:hypothetical protein
VFAAFVGAGFNSRTVFAVALVVMLILCLLGGHIRVAGRRGQVRGRVPAPRCGYL